ncbi:hypothetical protein B0O99DRAFT_171561 [Bisporella sp. PMI_857]|nr:hypothetical protein B0O99DRAFT_171561 [Bisporella sp. PMI_857]
MAPKGARRFAPKVKTGCITCRIRRIKCDETHPECQKCFSTGRKCDGYERPVLSRSMSMALGDVEGNRLFHLFRTLTSCQFSGDFEYRFWNRLVLQACEVNHSLRSAAIALASLHEGFLLGCQTSKSQKDVREVTLLQYDKALRETRKSLEGNEQSIVMTLMCSILLFCFESLRGELESAVTHLRSGLYLLRSSYIQYDTGQTAVKHDIVDIFVRLGFLTNCFIDNTRPISQALVVSQLKRLNSRQLESISCLDEAQASLYACLNDTMFSDHMEHQVTNIDSFSTEYHMIKCAQIILQGGRAANFEKGRENAIFALGEWHISFQGFLQTQGKPMNTKDMKASILLRLHHLVATLMLTLSYEMPREEINSRTGNGDFKQILDWAEFLIVEDPAIEAMMIPVLSPDVGVIAPVFFVATRCPDRTLREEAKRILALRPRREGLWDTALAIKIITDLNI